MAHKSKDRTVQFSTQIHNYYTPMLRKQWAVWLWQLCANSLYFGFQFTSFPCPSNIPNNGFLYKRVTESTIRDSPELYSLKTSQTPRHSFLVLFNQWSTIVCFSFFRLLAATCLKSFTDSVGRCNTSTLWYSCLICLEEGGGTAC